ncbi:MAG: antitoxin [Thaumarchaeota archaeon]|jgi:predicted CopG family antitoxin|nr:antitoxin [Nitrososphaerota archaeon]
MVKTITINDEAYRALVELKGEGESFSEVIVRILRGRRINLSEFYGVFRDNAGLWFEVEREILEDRRRASAR